MVLIFSMFPLNKCSYINYPTFCHDVFELALYNSSTGLRYDNLAIICSIVHINYCEKLNLVTLKFCN
jgi:hypothetical protein